MGAQRLYDLIPLWLARRDGRGHGVVRWARAAPLSQATRCLFARRIRDAARADRRRGSARHLASYPLLDGALARARPAQELPLVAIGGRSRRRWCSWRDRARIGAHRNAEPSASAVTAALFAAPGQRRGRRHVVGWRARPGHRRVVACWRCSSPPTLTSTGTSHRSRSCSRCSRPRRCGSRSKQRAAPFWPGRGGRRDGHVDRGW